MNWQGICLKDMTVQIVSGILNAHLMNIIQDHGTETQHCSKPGRGALDRIFVAQAALQTQNNNITKEPRVYS